MFHQAIRFIGACCVFILASCGSGGDNSASDSKAPSDTHNFIAMDVHYELKNDSLAAFNSGGGSLYFSGEMGIKRISDSQDVSVAPPSKLTIQYVNYNTGLAYLQTILARGAFVPADSLDGAVTAKGVWYYRDTGSYLGYSLPTGTKIRIEIVDVGDLNTNSVRFYINNQNEGYAPTLNVMPQPADVRFPIPVSICFVPGAV